jgi:hypothetical protein
MIVHSTGRGRVMKKDPRIILIERGDKQEFYLYILLMTILPLFVAMEIDGNGVGHFIVSIVFAMGGIRIRGELRAIRADAIRRENADRAERAGLAMPRLYEDVDDLKEAVQKTNEEHSKPAPV